MFTWKTSTCKSKMTKMSSKSLNLIFSYSGCLFLWLSLIVNVMQFPLQFKRLKKIILFSLVWISYPWNNILLEQVTYDHALWAIFMVDRLISKPWIRSSTTLALVSKILLCWSKGWSLAFRIKLDAPLNDQTHISRKIKFWGHCF